MFGVPRKRVATFEKQIKKLDGEDGYIDLLWKGILLIEHKSRVKDLDRAFQQAKDYFPGIKDRDASRYILVCDFARFRLYDLEEGQQNDHFAICRVPDDCIDNRSRRLLESRQFMEDVMTTIRRRDGCRFDFMPMPRPRPNSGR